MKNYEINHLSNDHLKLIYLVSYLRRELKESFKKCPITENQLKLVDKRSFRLDGLIFKKASSDLFDGDLENIEELHLAESSIGKKLNTDVFQNFKSLQLLDLEYNGITSLPDGVFNNH